MKNAKFSRGDEFWRSVDISAVMCEILAKAVEVNCCSRKYELRRDRYLFSSDMKLLQWFIPFD